MGIKLDLSPLDQSKKAGSEQVNPRGFALGTGHDTTKHSHVNKSKTDEEEALADAHMANLKMKKSWETALGPLKQAPVQGFMLYMSGNSVQIYSIMVTVMLFQNAVRGIASTQLAFARFETESKEEAGPKHTNSLLLPKIVYVFAQVVLIGLGLYKCHAMGLLPTSHSDWLSFLQAKTVAEYSSHDEFMFQFSCDACNKDITHVVKIACAVCKGADGEPLDLCVPCFAGGVETKGHLRSHDYIVKEGLDWPILESDWTAREELMLVDGLKLYGIGNYDQISTHIGTKTKEQVDDHYRRVYCSSELWPMPSTSATFNKLTSRRYVVRDPNPPMKKPDRSSASGPANHEIQGFMPGRDEFDQEFEQEAENPVKDMTFEDNESPEEISLKTTMLNIYNTTLDRRIERKKFLKDRNLTHDFRKLQNIEKKRTKDERDLLNRIRVFAKFQSSADFEEFTEGLMREQKLRQRIAELQEYRRMGCTTFTEAAEYEKEKYQRSVYKAAGLVNPINKLAGGRAPPPPIRGASSTLHRMSSTNSLSSGLQYHPSLQGNQMQPSTATPPIATLRNPKIPLNPLDISNADGVELLLPNEQQLCSNLRILPRAYQVIKETILREYAMKGGLTRKEARMLIKIDVNKTQQIYDLFVVNGWIQFGL
ncbi:Transcriptional adapter ada2 [Chytriomyces hyalinus]|nr:Transcriptional adapter ada2 [Chytriomyces hyalinus]